MTESQRRSDSRKRSEIWYWPQEDLILLYEYDKGMITCTSERGSCLYLPDEICRDDIYIGDVE